MCLCWLKAMDLGSEANSKAFTGPPGDTEVEVAEAEAAPASCWVLHAASSVSNLSLIWVMSSYFVASLPFSLSRSHKVSLTCSFPNGKAILSNGRVDFWIASHAASIKDSAFKRLGNNFFPFNLSKSDFAISLANPSFWEDFGEVTWQQAKATLSIGKVVLPCFQSQLANKSVKSSPNIKEPPNWRPQCQCKLHAPCWPFHTGACTG